MKTSGADILRLWVAASNYNEDVRISKEILDRLVDAYRKIRNTVRYLLGNLFDFDPPKDEVNYSDLLDLDKWALNRLSRTMEKIRAGYEAYDFPNIYRTIYAFCNDDLSSIYLDILKDRLYTSPAKSQERRSAQSVLFHILNCLVRAVSPILSFTSEEIFSLMPKTQETKKSESVHLLSWPVIPSEWRNGAVEQKFDILIRIRPHVLKALEEKRQTGAIGSSLEAKVVFQTAKEEFAQYLNGFQEILPQVFIVSQVEVRIVKDVHQSLGDEFSKTTIMIEKADGEKCSRCWNYSVHVGEDSNHPTLCHRCGPTVKEQQ